MTAGWELIILLLVMCNDNKIHEMSLKGDTFGTPQDVD